MAGPGQSKVTRQAIEKIVEPFRGEKGKVLKALHAIQHEFGYVGPEAIEILARAVGTSPGLLYGTMTYYEDYRSTPPPEHTVSICQGPACIAKGSTRLQRSAEALLGVGMGQETSDGSVGFHMEQCFGICDLAPYLRVDGEIAGNLEAQDLPRVLEEVTGVAPPDAQRDPSYRRPRVL